MTEGAGIWPDVPPEVPPPWRPDRPDPEEPGRRSPEPHVPLVVPPDRPGRLEDRGLLGHRTVLLVGPLEHESATQAAAQVMTLDAEAEGEISLHVACQDGDLGAALMLAETVDLTAAPVCAVAKGVVGGVALAPFAAAQRRIGSRRATFRLFEPRLALSGVASELTAQAEELLQQVDQLHAWLAAATGQPTATIADDFARRLTLDAEAALAYGLLDEIVTSSTRRADRDPSTRPTAS